MTEDAQWRCQYEQQGAQIASYRTRCPLSRADTRPFRSRSRACGGETVQLVVHWS
jgi:hypothetical protein